MRRDAIIEATIQVIGRKGYRATTVADIIAEAGVARTTFYKHFADKHECFLAAHDLGAERALVTVESGCDGGRPRLERVRAGLGSLVTLLATNPSLARVVVVEAAIAGTEGRRRQLAAIDRLARLLDEDSEASNVALMAVGAATGLLFDEIQAGRAGDLCKRLPELLFALLVPYVGPTEAAASARPLSYS